MVFWLLALTSAAAAQMNNPTAPAQPLPTQTTPAAVPPAPRPDPQALHPEPPAVPPAASAPTQPPPAAEPEDEPEVIVYLKDGRQFTGLRVAPRAGSRGTPDSLRVRIAGIETEFPTSEIERVKVLPPILDRYLDLRAAVGDDPDQIVKLAQWLQAREKYELALSEVLRALGIDPNNADARQLRTLLEQQIVLKMNKKEKKGPATEGSGEKRPDSTQRAEGFEFPYLSPEQIALMKVYEIDLKDNPRLVIPRAAVLRMLDKYEGNPLVPATREGKDAIVRKSPIEILDLMFRLQARDFYSQVEVLDQPRSITAFREAVESRWLINSCATSRCHGGKEAGRLVLSNRRPNSDASVYTNLYVLTHFRTAGDEPLINWDQPEKSVLLQMGMPRQESVFPHPVVPRGAGGHDAWRPVFRSRDDESFARSVEWIKSMYRPRPDYPFNYRPVRSFETSQGVQAPAPEPAAPATSAPPAAPEAPAPTSRIPRPRPSDEPPSRIPAPRPSSQKPESGPAGNEPAPETQPSQR